MKYSVDLTNEFKSDFFELPKKDQDLVISKIEEIRSDPNRSKYFLHKPLERLRRAYIGDRYRIFFRIQNERIFFYFIEPKDDKTYFRVEKRFFRIESA